eukprot:TRINITY_DN1202_c0_g1_i2.p2 TRINITY_DN1202_c0_g1~~TRINITY_DN1202_c0_g1_i2.p2  ORF type:complete len:128 (-),score=61.12 TRINITY_DN1202_c0_g1_i2:284-667(-)
MCIRDRYQRRVRDVRLCEMADAEDPQDAVSSEASKKAAQLDRVTDHHEEKELDASKVSEGLASLEAEDQAAQAAQRERARELAKVVVADDDIELVAGEMDISKHAAEQALRENQGDAKKTLSFLVHQ